MRLGPPVVAGGATSLAGVSTSAGVVALASVVDVFARPMVGGGVPNNTGPLAAPEPPKAPKVGFVTAAVPEPPKPPKITGLASPSDPPKAPKVGGVAA